MSEYQYSEAIRDFPKLFDLAINDRVPIKIKSNDGRSIVVMAEEDFDSFQETFYLLKNPFNASHLISSLEEKSLSFQSIDELKNEVGI